MEYKERLTKQNTELVRDLLFSDGQSLIESFAMILYGNFDDSVSLMKEALRDGAAVCYYIPEPAGRFVVTFDKQEQKTHETNDYQMIDLFNH